MSDGSSSGWLVLPLAVLAVGGAGYAYMVRKWNGEAERRVGNYSELQKQVSKEILRIYREEIEKTRSAQEFDTTFEDQFFRKSRIFYAHHNNQVTGQVRAELQKAGGLENYVKDVMVSLVEDFYNMLDHEALVLSRTLGTTMTVDSEMKINNMSLKQGKNDFLYPSKNSADNLQLHDFKIDTPEFKMLVNGMVRVVTTGHENFIQKKSEEIAKAYFDAIDARCKTLMTEGAEAASKSPFSIPDFETDDYFEDVAREYFPDKPRSQSQSTSNVREMSEEDAERYFGQRVLMSESETQELYGVKVNESNFTQQVQMNGPAQNSLFLA